MALRGGVRRLDRGLSIMDVASFCGLPVGAVRWRGPDPRLSVIVKATFDLAADGEAPLCAAQAPLTLDQQAPSAEHDELTQASDFVPHKARADVLLVGHAHRPPSASGPQPFAFSVGPVHKRGVAISKLPGLRVPLYERYLRRQADAHAESVRVGPVAAFVGGWPESFEGFDFQRFNVAPPDQQLDEIYEGSRLVLDGLLARGRADVQLPGLRPRVFCVSPGAASPLRLRCDTLSIDTDRACCVLTWRGSLPLTAEQEREVFVVVALESSARSLPWHTLASDLGRARWLRAVEPTDRPLRPAPVAPRGLTASPVAPASGPVAPLSGPSAPLDWPESATEVGDDDDAEANGPITVRRPALEPAPVAGRERLGTEEIALDAPRRAGPSFEAEADTPFMSGASSPPPASFEPVRERGATSVISALDGLEGAMIPFARDRAEPVAAESVVGEAYASPPSRDPRGTMDLDAVGLGGVMSALGAGGKLPFRASPAVPRAGQPHANFDLSQAGLTLDQGIDVDERRPVADVPSGTAALDRGAVRAVVLPFGAGDGATPPPEAAVSPPPRATGMLDAVDFSAAATPFVAGRPASMPPPVSLSAAERQAGHTVDAGSLRALSGPAFPFPVLGPPGPVAVRPPDPLRVAPDAAAVAPPSPVGAAPVPSASTSPALPQAPSLDLDDYAAVKVALWSGDRDRAEVLGSRDLREEDWRAFERRHALALAREASEGRSELATRTRRAVEAARAKQAEASEEAEGSSLEQYAELRVAIDEASDPGAVLRERGLTTEAWNGMRREWTHKSLADGELAQRLRAAIRAARKALRAEAGR